MALTRREFMVLGAGAAAAASMAIPVFASVPEKGWRIRINTIIFRSVERLGALGYTVVDRNLKMKEIMRIGWLPRHGSYEIQPAQKPVLVPGDAIVIFSHPREGMTEPVACFYNDPVTGVRWPVASPLVSLDIDPEKL